MLKQRVFFILLWLLSNIFVVHKIYAQEYSWKYYSVADGLPQTQIYRLYQDSKGYIWIGTKGGLSKFDGIEFENYTSKDGLDFDFVVNVQEDTSGGIYISTINGLNYLYEGKIQSIKLNNDGTARYVFVEENGTIWSNSGVNGLVCYQYNKKLDSHPLLEMIPEKKTIGFFSCHPESGRMIFSTENGKAFLWDGIKVTPFPENSRSINTVISRSGIIYGYTADSLYRVEGGIYSPVLSLRDHIVRYIASWNEIYLSDKTTYSQLLVFDGKDIHKFHQPFNMVMEVLMDDEKNLWVGTEAGLWRLQSKGFENFLSERDNNFYTWNVLPDNKGNYWFASFLYGLKKYDGQTFTDLRVNHLFKDNGFQYFYSGGILDEKGNILFATAKGVLKFDGTNFDWLNKDQETGAVMYIYFDPGTRHYYAVSARIGLMEFDEQFNLILHNDRPIRENTDLEISIVKDKYKRIWISGKKGICIKENGQWRNLPDEKDSIPIGAISMQKDDMGNIWLGSNDGLYFYDYHTLKKVGANIFDQQIGVLNITDNRELLIGSIKGIGLLNLEKYYTFGVEEIRYFDANNGFLGTECKHNSSFKDKTGSIWICTSDRVVKVNPEKLRSNPNPPRVYIESVSVVSETMEWVPILNIYSNEVTHTIDPDHDDLRFNYHGISHVAPLSVRYQTMLEGYDDSWSATTAERYRTYTNLPGGEYKFKVRAYNSDGIISQHDANLSFMILPKWHEILSVRIVGLIGLLAFAGLVGFLYSERIRKRKIAAERNERRIAKLQFNALKGLIDPHFTFNAINSIAAMVYKENRDEAYNYFTKFSRLIRSAFDNSNKTTRTIKEELAFVSNYLDIEKMRFKDRFDYQIEVDRSVNHDWKIPKMVVQIYVENSIKHGLMEREKDGFIKVKIGLSDDHLLITVKDNGIGRAKAKSLAGKVSSLGQGTKMIKEYFKLLNKFNDDKISTTTRDLKSSEGIAMGTEVIVSIPLNFKFNL
jgi:ligand-binding sensor domain-containing protein